MKNKKGFTLIEVVVVMAIIAVLTVLIVGAVTIARRTAAETAHRQNANAIRTALEAQYSRTRTYPTIANTGFATAAGVAANWGGTTVTLTTGGGVCANGGGTVTSGPAGYTLTVVAQNDCSTVLQTITGP